MGAASSIDYGKPRDGVVVLRLAGSWRTANDLPDPEEVIRHVEASPGPTRLEFEASGIEEWGSGLLTFLIQLLRSCAERSVSVDTAGLPQGVQRLIRLASAVPEREGARRGEDSESFLAYVGNRGIDFVRSSGEMLEFLGGSLIALTRVVRGKAIFRRVDLWLLMQETGAQALPIVGLISALVGMILAFVGAYQLKAFGAEIYIAAGVGVATVREMGPMMTGILIAGRTGASFAAQIGTMQVNDETDALSTMGISPTEFLVVPRLLAMGLMMPMLCLYADLMGILGGAVIGSGMYSIPLPQYFQQTWTSVSMSDFGVGIFKSVIFGGVVAIAGCLRGMQCGRSASAVGEAATSAVVTGIVSIIVIDSLAAVITTVIGV